VRGGWSEGILIAIDLAGVLTLATPFDASDAGSAEHLVCALAAAAIVAKPGEIVEPDRPGALERLSPLGPDHRPVPRRPSLEHLEESSAAGLGTSDADGMPNWLR
jgi:hypothetical protein